MSSEDRREGSTVYRVLLVEDEISIREGIRDIIDWKALGFSFAAEAKNGREAIDLFDSVEPDLVITDIHMPKMDGLGFISEIRERSRDTKLVILTGFDEFDYARRALKLNVQDYLLKPVSPQELTDVLRRVREQLDEAERRRPAAGGLADRTEARSLRRRMAMLKLISGITDSGDAERCLDGDEAVRAACWFCAVVYDFDGAHRSINPDRFRGRFRHLTPPGFLCELIPDNSGMLVEIVLASRGDQVAGDLAESIQLKRVEIFNETDLSISAGIGMAVSDFRVLHSSYRSAVDGLSRRYVRGGGALFAAEAPGAASGKEPAAGAEPILRFLKAVESGAFDEWEALLAGIVGELKESEATEEQSQEIMTLAISAMLNASRRQNGYCGVGDLQNSSIIKTARSYKTVDALPRWLEGLVRELIEESKEQRRDSSFTIAEDARNFIESNYMQSTLALEDLCSRLGVSPSTFSRAFKTYLDTNFSSYLRDVRIRAARRLLRRTDLRNKEIAFRVGFNSPHYFSHVFTKIVGYTPTEFRRTLDTDAVGRQDIGR